MRAAKIDANQTQIVSALRAAGASVQSLASVGKGCPDLLVAFHGALYLMEVKRGNGKVRQSQKEWHAQWRADVHVVYGPEDALKVIGAIHEQQAQ